MKLVSGRSAAAMIGGVALLATAWSIFSRTPDSAGNGVALVKRSDFELRVDVVGTLDAARGENVVSTLRGDRGKVVHIVGDGTRVEKGEVLARFDTAPIEVEILKLSGDLRSREAVVAYMRQAIELEKTQAEKALAHAELEVHAARQEHARHLAYIEDLEALSRRNIAIGGEIGQARRKAGAIEMQRQKAENSLERAKRESLHRIAQAMAEEKKAASEAASTRAALELARAELDKTTVRAPASGFVVLHEVFIADQKRRIRAGDALWQGQPLLYLPDLSAMIARTRVREEDLHKIRSGQEALVRVDAYPDLALRARVSGIGALALENASGGAAGKHFQMTVALEQGDERLRPGMTARISILAERANDVLAVPFAAVFYQGAQPFAYVMKRNAVDARELKLGRRGDDLVEVLHGLSEGDRVSLVRP